MSAWRPAACVSVTALYCWSSPVERQADERHAEQHADEWRPRRRGRRPSGARWFMPTAKLSPISHATISITPWMPKAIAKDSSGARVKLRRPSKVV